MTTRHRTRWTRTERSRLDTLISEGRSYQDIARQLRRTQASVAAQCHAYRILHSTTLTGLSGADVIRILGLCGKVTYYRIRRDGLLPVRRGARPYTIDDLYGFVNNVNTWMYWRADRITDDDLRRHAQMLRRNGPAWMTTGEAAKRCHVIGRTIADWCDRGELACVRYGVRRYIRSDVLAAFVAGRMPVKVCGMAQEPPEPFRQGKG